MKDDEFDFRGVNKAGQHIVSRLLAELVALRQAAATHLRYLDGEVVDGLRTNRHTREVVANIAEHQSRNLRWAIERTGSLHGGYADHSVQLPPQEAMK